MAASGMDLFWVIISFILTILVFSYGFGDHALFRFVVALFIGVSAGYFVVVLIFQVILSRLIVPLAAGAQLSLVPLILSGMLLTKLSPRFSRIGNIPMAYLVGAGAAIAIGGSVLGTLFGQVKGALNLFSPNADNPIFFVYLEGAFLLLGTLATLAYFHFHAKTPGISGGTRAIIVSIFAWIGRIFIAITLGAVFASVLTAAATALIERSNFLIQTIKGFIG
jgi:hypothetical protein